MNTLVLCLGNDIRGDDGVGWAVADALGGWGLGTGGSYSTCMDRSPESDLAADGAADVSPVPSPQSPVPTVKRSALSGFYLLDELIGYDRVIVVDAVKTGLHPPGTVLSFPFEILGTETGPSPHSVGLPSVVRLGRQSGVPLPTDIHIVAVEIDDMETIAEGLTGPIRDAVPRAAAKVRSLLAAGLPC